MGLRHEKWRREGWREESRRKSGGFSESPGTPLPAVSHTRSTLQPPRTSVSTPAALPQGRLGGARVIPQAPGAALSYSLLSAELTRMQHAHTHTYKSTNTLSISDFSDFNTLMTNKIPIKAIYYFTSAFFDMLLIMILEGWTGNDGEKGERVRKGLNCISITLDPIKNHPVKFFLLFFCILKS